MPGSAAPFSHAAPDRRCLTAASRRRRLPLLLAGLVALAATGCSITAHRAETVASLRPPAAAIAPAEARRSPAAVETAPPVEQQAADPPSIAPPPARAEFAGFAVTPAVRTLADWIARTGDHQDGEFLIVDKPAATVYVFDADVHLRATSPVLVGAAIGDRTVPGIGSRPIADVRPEERTTPAGRFVAERGHNAHGKDVVWIDYDAAVSMHRVIDTVPAERRLQRLATPTPDDNRISYGCINVPVAFFESTIRPIFAEYRAIVYILPEVESLQAVFGIADGQRLVQTGR